ncbi:MAG: HAD family hydrolase, partial [Ardenticatenaceae bacterium]|nr:HAD family hydrolase [Ardenticatenaceae bacterium]
MTLLHVNGRSFTTELIAFDKDGTLVNFHHLWGHKTRRWVAAMVEAVAGDEVLQAALFRTLGFSVERNRVVADGPVAVASNPKIYGVAAAVLYQHGLGWHQAETLAQGTGSRIFGARPTADLIQPIGDVAGTMKRLHAAGIRVAIVTSDDRAATEATLPLLGIEAYVDVLVCGNDPLPNKPDPAGWQHLAQRFGIEPVQMMMVGDTESDMVFGRNG